MSDAQLQAIRDRLAAFASPDEITWPAAEHLVTEGQREQGFTGPYLVGTYLPVKIVGRNLADDYDGWQQYYPELTSEQLVAARDYYLVHADLFQAQRWRDVQFDRRYQPGGNGERLRADIRALLALVDRMAPVVSAARKQIRRHDDQCPCEPCREERSSGLAEAVRAYEAGGTE